MEEYNLKALIKNVRVLSECRTCIYGLPQAGCFSYMTLVKYLDDDCYFPTGHTPGLFRRLIQSCRQELWHQNIWEKFWPYNQYIKNTTTSLLIGMVKSSVELS